MATRAVRRHRPIPTIPTPELAVVRSGPRSRSVPDRGRERVLLAVALVGVLVFAGVFAATVVMPAASTLLGAPAAAGSGEGP